MHQEREHRNLEPATADLYLFGTIRIPEKVARIIAFIGAITSVNTTVKKTKTRSTGTHHANAAMVQHSHAIATSVTALIDACAQVAIAIPNKY